jgi:hypothetical protein
MVGSAADFPLHENDFARMPHLRANVRPRRRNRGRG